MINRTTEDWLSNPLQKLIEPIHLPIIQDRAFLGCDVFTITDIKLLSTWWHRGEKLGLNHTEIVDYKTRLLKELHAAVWIQLNILHPKPLLTFQDVSNEVTNTAAA